MTAVDLLLVYVLVGIVCLSLCWAQAPGDEDARCTTDHSNPPQYPDNVTNLMDSYSYENLLPGNGTGNTPIATAVWNDFSFDGNDVTPETLSPTYWQQGAGGICRFQTRVCGWRQNGVVVSQNNWLFTQHISPDFDSNIYNYDVAIHVGATYSLQSCRERQDCRQRFNLLHYMTSSQQLPSTSGNGYMNTQNYENFAVPEGPVSSATYTNTYSFTLPPSSTGFYIAVQDIGSCIALSRLRVYRYNCKSRQVGLVRYPDAPAPVSDSANISISCVENAVVSGSSEVTCRSNGTWGPETPVCQCRLGYEDRQTECIACGAGQYRSREDTTCQSCPAGTKTDKEAAPECECLDGFFRNNASNNDATVEFENPRSETPDYGCTKPPSAPENVIVVAISPREILATWSPPTDHGGRFDLYYEVKISDPQILGEFTPSVYLTNITTRHVFPELTPFTAYCVRVTAHNGVSDQDPDRTHLRTVESCTETPEDEPGPVETVKGHCSVLVWDEPSAPNGVITNYSLLFLLNTGNDPGVVVTTDSSVTHFDIKSRNQFPLSPADGGSAFVKVRAQNGAGLGPYSQSAYIGCEDPPGTCTNDTSPFPPPTVPELVVSVEREGDVIYWSRPSGRVSYYLVTLTDDETGEKLVEGMRTNEQFLVLSNGSYGKLSVEICTELDGVRGSCTQHEILEETGKRCTEESSGEVSQEMIIALCAGCGGTALLVATCCLIAAALHHWRFRRQFGSHKEALTWEAYELKT